MSALLLFANAAVELVARATAPILMVGLGTGLTRLGTTGSWRRKSPSPRPGG